jgi:hypothetical protein
MQRALAVGLSLAPLLGLLGVCALLGCSEAKPPETPETPAASSEPAASAEPSAEAAPADTAMPGKVVNDAKVDKSMSLDTYELTPSDCEALGRQYGVAARADQMGALSPKISEKQRAATAAQVDKVVSKLEDSWIGGCQSSLVNKAVDRAAIKCAMAAKTVKAFDVCLNGEGGTPQPAGKPKKK